MVNYRALTQVSLELIFHLDFGVNHDQALQSFVINLRLTNHKRCDELRLLRPCIL